MISTIDRTRVAASPERVWEFFTEMESHYLEWHREHLAWRDLKGKVTTTGGVVFADEYVGPLRLAGRFFTEEAVAPRFFRFRLGFPFSLVRAGGSFRINPTSDGGCDVTAETHLGYRTPIIGGLMDRVFEAVLALDELRRHMREEGENLAQLVASIPRGVWRRPSARHPTTSSRLVPWSGLGPAPPSLTPAKRN